MEQQCDILRQRIHTSEIWALKSVATIAREREVQPVIVAAMLPCRDVLNV